MAKGKGAKSQEKEMKEFESDLKCMTLLMTLAGDGKADELSHLCKHISVIDEVSPNQKWTPLIWAVFTGQVESVRVLLNAGANPNHRDKSGSTPLMHATLCDEKIAVAIAKLLLAKGADTEIADKTGKTVLMLTAASGKLLLAKLLLKSGADIHAEDKDGSNAVDYSEYSDNDKMYDFLIKYWAAN